VTKKEVFSHQLEGKNMKRISVGGGEGGEGVKDTYNSRSIMFVLISKEEAKKEP